MPSNDSKDTKSTKSTKDSDDSKKTHILTTKGTTEQNKVPSSEPVVDPPKYSVDPLEVEKWVDVSADKRRYERFPSYLPEEPPTEDTAPVKTVDVILFPVHYRKFTLLPLPFLLFGAGMNTASLFVSPWLEYTILAEGKQFNQIYRQHVKTGLFEQCRTMRYKGDWVCDAVVPKAGDFMTNIQFMLMFNIGLTWCGFLLALVQSFKVWLQETGEEVNKNIPGVMLPYLGASIITYLACLQLTLTLYWFQHNDGGSASTGFFMCEMGVVSLFIGAVLSWRVALKPTKNPAPWKVDTTHIEDESESEEEEMLYYVDGAQSV